MMFPNSGSETETKKTTIERNGKMEENEMKEPVTEAAEPETETKEIPEEKVEDFIAGRPGKESKKQKKELDEAKKTIEEQKKQLEKAKSDYDELSDKYTRMIAEYDNFRKRAQKEKEGIYADACADTLKEILTVKDNLELAVKYSEGEKVVDGVKMTLSKFTETLTKLGVEEFGEAGDDFDPELHNAVMHSEEEGAKENSVAEVLLKGYKKGDKILRYAMVRVVN